MTKLDDALKLLREERSRIDSAIAALTGGDHKSVTKAAGALTEPASKKRKMSAAARRRIADAQKKRWAAQKAKATK
jgi:hypothetical protein